MMSYVGLLHIERGKYLEKELKRKICVKDVVQ